MTDSVLWCPQRLAYWCDGSVPWNTNDELGSEVWYRRGSYSGLCCGGYESWNAKAIHRELLMPELINQNSIEEIDESVLKIKTFISYSTV